MDEFAPFAYSNFSRILQTARGGNVAFMFALQNYGQLDPVGFGLKDSLTSGPNNAFMMTMKDDKTTEQFRKEGGEVKRDRVSVRVEKGGILTGNKFEEQTSGTKSDFYELQIRDEQLKRLPRGQMQVVMSDPDKGMVHKHIHVRRPDEHFIANKEINNLYPVYGGADAGFTGSEPSFSDPRPGSKTNRLCRQKNCTWREEIVKHRTLGIIFIAATLAGNAQQPQKAQPDDPQSQDGVAPNQAFIPGAQQGGAGSSQQQPGPFERRPTPPVNWNHNHEVYPNTDQLPDNGDSDDWAEEVRRYDTSERG